MLLKKVAGLLLGGIGRGTTARGVGRAATRGVGRVASATAGRGVG